MTISCQYYQQESDDDLEMEKVVCSPERAIDIIAELCYTNSLPKIEVRFHAKHNKNYQKSWYQPPTLGKEEHISFDQDTINCLVIAHEFSHYAHFYDYQRRKNLLAAINGPGEHLPREIWHGPEHQKWVQRTLKFIKTKEWHLQLVPDSINTATFPSPLPPQNKKWLDTTLGILLDGRDWSSLELKERKALETTLRIQHTQTLPPTLYCPRCQSVKSREEIGSRVVRRGGSVEDKVGIKNEGKVVVRARNFGIPTLVYRQSYCRGCRLQFKKRGSP